MEKTSEGTENTALGSMFYFYQCKELGLREDCSQLEQDCVFVYIIMVPWRLSQTFSCIPRITTTKQSVRVYHLFIFHSLTRIAVIHYLALYIVSTMYAVITKYVPNMTCIYWKKSRYK